MISFIYIPCSVIVNSLINIEHTFRSIIFDFYQRPIYMVEYMVNPVESTIERIGNRVHIIQTGAGRAETARAITDQPVTLVGETEAAAAGAGAGAPIEPSKVVVVVIIGIYFIWVMTKGTIGI